MKRFLLRLREGLWVTPAMYSLLAILLSTIMFYIDSHYIDELQDYLPSILMTSVDLAKTIMGGLSSALLTMTTFTFSTIMVVLTTYSSQFSPRTLKNFVYQKMTWRVLGVFMGGFLYNTLSLLFMRNDLYNHMVLSATVGILIALVCLTFFAVFIHHTATSIQASMLIDQLANDAEEAIQYYQDLGEKYGAEAEWTASGETEWHALSETDGYIQWIDFKGITLFAKDKQAVIKLLVQLGDFVHRGQAVFHLYATENPELNTGEYVVVGREPDTRQDPEFAIRKLTEVALRAISPGINDPNTAIHNIRQIGRLLGQMSHISGRYFIFSDEDQVARLAYHLNPFKKILYSAFFQIRHYGREDISVLAAIAEALTIASELSDEHVQNDIWNLQLYIIEGIDKEKLLSLDRDFYQEKIDHLARVTGNKTIHLPK